MQKKIMCKELEGRILKPGDEKKFLKSYTQIIMERR